MNDHPAPRGPGSDSGAERQRAEGSGPGPGSPEPDLGALCRLAHLRLQPERRAELERRLRTVVAAFATIATVDTAAVRAPELPRAAPLRADVPGGELTQDQALANASRTAAGCFSVPRVVEG